MKSNTERCPSLPRTYEFKLFKLNGKILPSPIDSLAVAFDKLGVPSEARAIVEIGKGQESGEIKELYDADGSPLEPPNSETLNQYLATREGMKPGLLLHDPNGISRVRLEAYLQGTTTMREGICYEPVPLNLL